MKRWTPFLILATAVALMTTVFVGPSEAGDKKEIVGAWYVDTIGAPFAPHGISFHADGIVDLTNPDAAEATNSSSAGMGQWVAEKSSYKGTFFEVNADKSTNAFTTLLVVTFEVTVNGDRFEGPASASYYDGNRNLVDGPFPATLKGQRFTVGGPIPDPI